jgi:hypothetical protein
LEHGANVVAVTDRGVAGRPANAAVVLIPINARFATLVCI